MFQHLASFKYILYTFSFVYILGILVSVFNQYHIPVCVTSISTDQSEQRTYESPRHKTTVTFSEVNSANSLFQDINIGTAIRKCRLGLNLHLISLS